MERKGKTLQVISDGHPRRLSDGRNAWRKMNDEQRVEFLHFIREETPAFLTIVMCPVHGLHAPCSRTLKPNRCES